MYRTRTTTIIIQHSQQHIPDDREFCCMFCLHAYFGFWLYYQCKQRAHLHVAPGCYVVCKGNEITCSPAHRTKNTIRKRVVHEIQHAISHSIILKLNIKSETIIASDWARTGILPGDSSFIWPVKYFGIVPSSSFCPFSALYRGLRDLLRSIYIYKCICAADSTLTIQVVDTGCSLQDDNKLYLALVLSHRRAVDVFVLCRYPSILS